MSFSFKKSERLTGKKIIEALMKKGNSINAFPVRAVFLGTAPTSLSPVQVVFSVPKASFKSAVKRNTIRRRMREAYRLNKHALYSTLKEQGKQVALMLIYTAKTELPYRDIESKIVVTLKLLSERA